MLETEEVSSLTLLIALPDSSDGGAKLITLSPELKTWLEVFFDHAAELFKEALS